MITVSMLGLLLISSVFAIHANASNAWIGNDNGEFATSSCQSCKFTNGYVAFYSYSSSSMSYSSSTGYVSIQYNQDWDTDLSYQPAPYYYGGTDWVQAVFDGDSSNNCLGVAMEVINQAWGWNDYFWQYNNNVCGTHESGMFSSGAQWYIAEFTSSSGKINEVSYSVQGGTWNYVLYPPVNWYWLRSQICWCGGYSGDYATFHSGSGTLDYYAGQGGSVNTYSIGPPSDRGTGEDSNMGWSCFVNSGTTFMYQSFGPSQPIC